MIETLFFTLGMVLLIAGAGFFVKEASSRADTFTTKPRSGSMEVYLKHGQQEEHDDPGC